mmetsp:Transcript_20470/g.30195  ORF Transcript_20470/g.30195 Transcript_20470/m.30195 type:complete len:112 (+) Transcript_20470:230-565(+)
MMDIVMVQRGRYKYCDKSSSSIGNTMTRFAILSPTGRMVLREIVIPLKIMFVTNCTCMDRRWQSPSSQLCRIFQSERKKMQQQHFYCHSFLVATEQAVEEAHPWELGYQIW